MSIRLDLGMELSIFHFSHRVLFFRPQSVPLATLYCDFSLFLNKTLSQQDCGQLQGKDPCIIGDHNCLEGGGGHNFVKKAKSTVTGWSVGLCLLSQKCG